MNLLLIRPMFLLSIGIVDKIPKTMRFHQHTIHGQLSHWFLKSIYPFLHHHNFEIFYIFVPKMWLFSIVLSASVLHYHKHNTYTRAYTANRQQLSSPPYKTSHTFTYTSSSIVNHIYIAIRIKKLIGHSPPAQNQQTFPRRNQNLNINNNPTVPTAPRKPST